MAASRVSGIAVRQGCDGELLKFGIDVGQTSVAKYMVRKRSS